MVRINGVYIKYCNLFLSTNKIREDWQCEPKSLLHYRKNNNNLEEEHNCERMVFGLALEKERESTAQLCLNISIQLVCLNRCNQYKYLWSWGKKHLFCKDKDFYPLALKWGCPCFSISIYLFVWVSVIPRTKILVTYHQRFLENEYFFLYALNYMIN